MFVLFPKNNLEFRGLVYYLATNKITNNLKGLVYQLATNKINNYLEGLVYY